MKSGTTSLHSYLASHPQIFMCPEKEPEFFAKESIWSRGEDWYLGLFAGADEQPLIGESSTVYSRIPHFAGVADRIAKFNPEARFIYIMRDPVERTISHYWFCVRFCKERRDMLTAIREEAHLTDVSNYAMQLVPYFARFGSDKVFTLTFEELSTRPANIVQTLFQWLGVEASFVPPNLGRRENVTPEVIALRKIGLINHVGRALKPLIPPDMFSAAKHWLQRYQYIDRKSSTVDEVIRFLKPVQTEQVNELEKMLGRGFPEWKTLYGHTSVATAKNHFEAVLEPGAG
jgi:hypothetical protein